MKVILIALLVFLFYIAFKVLRFFSQISKAVENSKQNASAGFKMNSNPNAPQKGTINKKDIVDADFVDIKEEKEKHD
ncbi:MAG: hypothetical protein Q8N03_01430 [Ignavibacteria bacterium]|jgi:hypothetical protein|nr:hypothetical protein [Ignavibacteria bacterium]